MVELISGHKTGLELASPVLIAAGFGGYGDVYHSLIDMSLFGAVVTRPITLRPRRALPRMVELSNGFLVETHLQNPGVRKIIARFATRSRLWARLSLPVIAHLPADIPDDLSRTARAMAENTPIIAIELGLPTLCYPDEAYDWVEAIRTGCELPLLVKVSLETTTEHLAAIAQAGADILVVSAPPRGSAYRDGQLISGDYYGPMLYHQALNKVAWVVGESELPVIAGGGIHKIDDARAFLECGARAVQIDSLMFINPQQAADIAGQLRII
jgi:dihydroorotate dehydrogenase (NAD+) catalytic subunit